MSASRMCRAASSNVSPARSVTGDLFMISCTVCATVHHAAGITSELSASLGVGTGGRVIGELF